VRRIAVVGVSGSGKTRLARELARRLDLPLVELDLVYWRPGWAMPSREEWVERHRAALAGEAWVADGNNGSTMAERLELADAVYFLDLPPALCYWRVLRRTVVGLVRRTSHLGADYPERPAWILESARYVFTYRSRRGGRVLELLERHPHAVTLRSRRAVRRLLAGVPRRPGRITPA
jgi:adenylate kinase family enzyme